MPGYINFKRKAEQAFGSAANAYYAYSRYKRSPPRQMAYTKGSQAQYTVARPKKKTSNKSFRGKLLNELQNYHETSSQVVNLTHNAIFTKNMCSTIIQGLTIDDRQGDQIYLTALKIRGSYQLPTTAGAFSMRMIVGYSGAEYVAGTFVTGVSGLDSTQLFLPDTYSGGWGPNGIINPKAFTVIYDSVIDQNSLTTTTAEVQSFAASIPLDKNFPYKAGESIYGKFKNLYVVLIGGVAGGVAEQPAGNVAISMDVIFKNK